MATDVWSPSHSFANSYGLDYRNCADHSGLFGSIEVVHKPRGSGATWTNVGECEKVRVSSQSGKHLRVILRTQTKLDENTIEMLLTEQSNDGSWIPCKLGQDYVVTSVDNSFKNGMYIVVYDVKLHRLHKHLRFQATVKSDDGIYVFHTIEFRAHNTGTAKKRKQKSESPSPSSPNIELAVINSNVPSPTDHLVDRKQCSNLNCDINSDLVVHGNAIAQSFLQHSDVRLKTNIEDILDAIETVQRLSGKMYRWKADDRGKTVIGLIAQEVAKVVPEAVVKLPNGYLAVDYAQLLPILIEAFKQMTKEFREIKEYFELNSDLQTIASDLRGLIEKLSTSTQSEKSLDTSSSTHSDSGFEGPSRRRHGKVAQETVTIESRGISPTHAKSSSVSVADKQSVRFFVRIARQPNWLKVVIVLLAMFVIGGIVAASVGLALGLTSDSSSDNPADPMEIIWEPSDELQNGDFENYDEGGKVKGWDGDYDIGIITNKPEKKRGIEYLDYSVVQALFPTPFEAGNVFLVLGREDTLATVHQHSLLQLNATKKAANNTAIGSYDSIYSQKAVQYRVSWWSNSVLAKPIDDKNTYEYYCEVTLIYLNVKTNRTYSETVRTNMALGEAWTHRVIIFTARDAHIPQELFFIGGARVAGKTYWDHILLERSM